jgi:hypothetical protein
MKQAVFLLQLFLFLSEWRIATSTLETKENENDIVVVTPTKPTTTTASSLSKNALRGALPRQSSSTIDSDGDKTSIHDEKQATGAQGMIEIVSSVDQDALQRCLQRRDLEEVFGLEMGVVCTCITANTVTAEIAEETAAEDETSFTNGRNATNTSINNNTSSNSSSSSSSGGITTVQIIVQLSCTDSRSRFNTGGVAGQYAYCLPKDEYCTEDTADQCCGNRYCDLQRNQCTAPPSTTSMRNGKNVKIGQDNGSYRDDPDRERPETAASEFPNGN